MSVSSDLVAMMVMSSAYAIAIVLAPRDPCSFLSRLITRGLNHKADSNMLNGQPCLTPLCVCICLDLLPFIVSVDVAFAYIFCNRLQNRSLIPYSFSIKNRKECDILSKSSLKSIVSMHVGLFVSSAEAITSLTVAVASKILCPGRPHY